MNIEYELIKNEIEQNNLMVQAIKDQKYNELVRENKRLEEKIKELENVILTDKFNFAKPILKEYEVQILKSRIDKAIEYINWFLEANKELTDMGIGLCVNNVEALLEILKGSDK